MSDRPRIRAEQLPESYARNFVAMVADATLCEFGINLVSITTVIPAFVDALNGSASMVGLISGIVSGAALLPQLFAANLVSRGGRRKPMLMWGAWLGRPLYMIFAVLIMLLATSRPGTLLWVLVAFVGLFYLCDSFVTLPWMDLFGTIIPERRRGRLIGTYQILGGLGGIAMGAIVSWLLGTDSKWGFPANFAMIFGLASVAFMLAGTSLIFVREPQNGYKASTPPSISETFKSIPKLLNRDRAFLRLIMAKVAAGFIIIASSFYVLHAVRVSGLAIANTGLLISAQVTGTIAAGLLTTFIQDTRGPIFHIRLTCLLAALPSLGALALSLLSDHIQAPLPVYLAIFFVLGLSLNSLGWPFYNWLIEYASTEDRPVYLGTVNTLSALTMLAPPIGGLLVDQISYEAAFIAASVAALIALALSMSLPSTRANRADGVETADGTI